MFIEAAWLLLPSSVGAKCDISLLRSLGDKRRPNYKHLAPLALMTLHTHRKHWLGITHTLHIKTDSSRFRDWRRPVRNIRLVDGAFGLLLELGPNRLAGFGVLEQIDHRRR